MAVLADASLSVQERRVVEGFVQRLLEERVPLEAVWLYGSRARGEAPRPESDVDLMVLVADRGREKQRVRRLLYDAAEAASANPAFFSAQVWDERWLADRRRIESLFLQELERERIVIYPRP
jgi:predicted nucleotidyltransferase